MPLLSRRITALCLSALLVCGVCSSRADASNWPRFRGENGTGISEDEIPVEIDGSKPIWKIELPGPGNGSPIVWDGKIVLQTAAADGSQRKLVCVALKDGQILWTQDAPGGIPSDPINNKNTLASGTAATDGQRIYVPFWDGNELSLHAYDFSGKPLWRRGLGSFLSQHGAGHSPMVVGDKVVVALDQDKKASLVALNAATGEIAWETPRPPSRANYSTPILVDQPGVGPALVVASTPGFAAYRPDTGEELWHWNWKNNPLRTVGSPVFGNGLVVIGSGNGAGARHAVAIRAGGQGDVSSTALAWEEKKTLPYVPTMLVTGEHLFFVNDGGVAGCYEIASGKELWTLRLGGNFSASPILVGGRIYAINEQGKVFVLEAGVNPKLLHRTSIDDTITATPAVADNRLVVRGLQTLYCFGK